MDVGDSYIQCCADTAGFEFCGSGDGALKVGAGPGVIVAGGAVLGGAVGCRPLTDPVDTSPAPGSATAFRPNGHRQNPGSSALTVAQLPTARDTTVSNAHAIGRIAFHASRKVWLSNLGSLGPSEKAWPEICPHLRRVVATRGSRGGDCPKNCAGRPDWFSSDCFRVRLPIFSSGTRPGRRKTRRTTPAPHCPAPLNGAHAGLSLSSPGDCRRMAKLGE